MTMIQKVERAIEENSGSDSLDQMNPNYSQNLRQIARAAIEAMREPTEAMRSVYVNPASIENTNTLYWQAMIDAALKEGAP